MADPQTLSVPTNLRVEPAANALSTEDYRQLWQMSTSPDDTARQQAQQLASKLTMPERINFARAQHQFNQEAGNGAKPIDRNIMGGPSGAGVPPEAALLAAPAMLAGSLPAAAGVLMKTIGKTAADVGKFAVIRTGLTKLGVPPGMADTVALVFGVVKPSMSNTTTLGDALTNMKMDQLRTAAGVTEEEASTILSKLAAGQKPAIAFKLATDPQRSAALKELVKLAQSAAK